MQRRTDSWQELRRTATTVRAEPFEPATPAPRRARGIVRIALIFALASVATIAGAVELLQSPGRVAADGGADSTLFSLTNQDRASNGVGSVNFNGTLQTIGEGGGYNCNVHVNGRAVDMIQRNYFSHVIQGCGVYVFAMMSAYGVRYRSAGENIGWVSNIGGGGAAANYINGQFMNSPEHRDNILNGNYTDLGVGSDLSPSGYTWTGSGSHQNVWMFAEEFAQLGPSSSSSSSSSSSNSGGSSRNSPAPPPPAQTPVIATPAPTPTPTPVPTPTPIPSALLPSNVPAPPTYVYPGLLPTTVESVLASFLIA
ncbi:MAG: CAP domain-containing protein [Candidatus Dormibacteria bacterium]